MKNLLLGLILISPFVMLAQKNEVRSVSSFKGVKVSQAIDVYLKKGDKESVKVVASGVDLSDVVTEVEGTTLRVRMRDNIGGFFSKADVKAYFTYVNLERISASSAASVFSEGIVKTNSIDIGASSAA